MVMKMRFVTVSSIGALAVFAAMAIWSQSTEHKKIEGAVGCKSELVLIDYWKSLNLIREVKHEGDDLVVIVDWRSWANMPRSSQLAIGNAAFCPIALSGKNGIARIEDLNGKEFARVAAGKWSSKQFPE
jgi:hypothetical protein